MLFLLLLEFSTRVGGLVMVTSWQIDTFPSIARISGMS